jgi:undecaprenyl-diphosphatase
MTAAYAVVVILAIIQGFTEFFPISSSGHLVIFQELFRMRGHDIGNSMVFDVAVHVGTLGAVIVFYREKLLVLCKAFFSLIAHGAGGFKTHGKELTYIAYLVIGTIPAGVVGVLFNDRIERTFNSPALVSILLVATGIFLLASRLRCVSWNLTWYTALLIGLAQAVAILPGISRSGWTITAGLLLGLGFTQAAEFSFLLAVPAILGALVLELMKKALPLAGHSALPLAVGAVGAFLTGLLALRLIIGILNRGAFHRFAYYLIPAGIAAFLFFKFWFAGLQSF